MHRLTAVLVTLTILLPVSRWALPRISTHPFGAAPPPATASAADQIKYFQQRIQAAPRNSAAYAALGVLEERGGRYTAAVTHLRQARTLGAPDGEVTGPLGRALLRLAHFGEAHTELQRATAVAPDSVEAAVNLAGFYRQVNGIDREAACLREFIARHPAFAAPNAAVDPEDLKRLLLCVAEASDGEMTVRLSSHLARLCPNDPGAYALAGGQLLSMNRPAEAADLLSRACTLAPTVAVVHYNYGVALSQTGRTDAALAQWQGAVRLNPDALNAYESMGEEYARRQDWEKAAIAYAKSAARSASDSRICLRAAAMYERAGRPLLATYWRSLGASVAKDYETALRLARQVAANPDPAWHRRGLDCIAADLYGLHRNQEYLQVVLQQTAGGSPKEKLRLADAYSELDMFDQEEVCLRSVLATLPSDSSSAAYIHYRLGRSAQKRDLRDDAEREIDLAVQLAPGATEYHRALATLLFERRDIGDRLPRAIHEYETVVAQTPQDENAWKYLGIANEAAGDLPNAVDHLQHAIDLEPGDGPLYLEMGRVYARMGDRRRSEEQMSLYRSYTSFEQQRQILTTRASQQGASGEIALADFMARTGDAPSAAEHYAAVLQAQPNDPETLRKLARAYGQMGRKDEALSLERRAARISHPVAGAQ